MSNIYRVLGEYEEIHCKLRNKIMCNSDFDGYCLVDNYDNRYFNDNLDDIISHLQHGNTTCSKWISCSTDLLLDIEKYSVSNLQFPKERRPKIAIVRNHSESCLKIKNTKINIFNWVKNLNNDDLKNEQYIQLMNYIRNKKNDEIEKMVLNLEDDRLLYNLFELGFIKTKNEKKPCLTSRAFNYGRCSKEILVFSQIENKFKKNLDRYNLIPIDNITYLLKPIEYDVIYSLIKTSDISNSPSNKDFINIIKSINTFPKSFDKREISFYRNHYGNNETLEAILNNYNDKRLDYLSLHQELLKIKRSIISKIINWINLYLDKNYNSKDIHLIEDNTLILRNAGNYQVMNAQLMDGTNIYVPPIDDTNSIFCCDEIKKNISSIYSCGESNTYYTLYNNKLCRIPDYNIFTNDKEKKYIKKIG